MIVDFKNFNIWIGTLLGSKGGTRFWLSLDSAKRGGGIRVCQAGDDRTRLVDFWSQ